MIVEDSGKRQDHLVVGSSSVPNFWNFEDTLKFCNDEGLIHGLEHPAVEAHFGSGLEKAEKLVDKCLFVEGHNAQLIWPAFLRGAPVIGEFTRASNARAKGFARAQNKPSIATSDAHRIEDAGIAYIEFDKNLLQSSNEDDLLLGLRRVVQHGLFEVKEGYESVGGWINWVGKFMWGVKMGRYKTAEEI